MSSEELRAIANADSPASSMSSEELMAIANPKSNVQGVADEMIGGLPLVGPWLQRGLEYATGLDYYLGGDAESISQGADMARAQTKAWRADNPIVGPAANVVGGMTGLAAPITMAPKMFGVAGTGSKALRMGRSAATMGGIEAAHSASEQLAETGQIDPLQTGISAAGGLIGGAASPRIDDLVSAGISRGLNRQTAANVPTADDLALQSGDLYDQAYNQGVAVTGSATRRLADQMRNAAGRINDRVRPRTAGMADDLTDMAGKPMSLEVLDELRQEFSAEISKAGAKTSDGRTLIRMKSALDDFANNMRAGPDVSGNPEVATPLLNQAREVWQRKLKTDLINETIDLGELASGRYTQSGLRNALRDKFAQLERKLIRNKSEAARFSPEEREMIRQLAEGKVTSRALNVLSTAAPRGAVSAILGILAGTTIPGGAALPVAGLAAAHRADKAAGRAASNLLEAVATGVPPRRPMPKPPSLPTQALTRSLPPNLVQSPLEVLIAPTTEDMRRAKGLRMGR